MRELWFLIGVLFWDFFSILWVLKIKLLHFHKHPKRRTHKLLHMLNCLPTKKGIYTSPVSIKTPLHKVFCVFLSLQNSLGLQASFLGWVEDSIGWSQFQGGSGKGSSSCENGWNQRSNNRFSKRGKLGNLFSFGCFWEISVGRKKVSFVGGWCIFVKWNLGRKMGFRYFYTWVWVPADHFCRSFTRVFWNLFMQGDGWWVILLMLQKKSC